MTTWALVIMLFGGNGAGISTDLRFSDQLACETARDILIAKGQPPNKFAGFPWPVCIPVRQRD